MSILSAILQALFAVRILVSVWSAVPDLRASGPASIPLWWGLLLCLNGLSCRRLWPRLSWGWLNWRRLELRDRKANDIRVDFKAGNRALKPFKTRAFL